MRDFNFFEPYINLQTKPKKNIILFVILGALLLAALVYYQYLLYAQQNALKGDIAEIQAFINSPNTINKIGEIEQKQARFDELVAVKNDLLVFSDEVTLSDKIDDMLVEQINAQMPSNLFLREMSMNSNTITINGYSQEFASIAQFAYNLRDSNKFSDVLIPTIVENNGNYDYTLTVVMNAGGSDENQ